ncbi:MAG: maleylpyruvate isomerase N-terminal domain-containing protein [Chloroflexi bacterium]|nr:maleylpyruvate isomerase N-terminal domain-containing protein [Chloroflexota bacterium]MBI3733862.1 maleylpyruvate isomerase N-terminal domain-containing protein [Chloroflexota bacterium]
MRPPEPIIVAHLFPEVHHALIDLLSGLSAEQWMRPVHNSGWTVHDTALHLLGGDAGILSHKRDGYASRGAPREGWHELVAFINGQNERWVQATRRISPRLLCDFLRLTGEQVSVYFQSLDPHALGGPVDWTGPGPAPVWLDLAREYTERWHHQQHIRDAVGRPGLKEPRFFAPVLDTFARALPHTLREVDAPVGTAVVLTIHGAAGGRWWGLREARGWGLYRDVAGEPQAEVALDQEIAWRLLTKGIGKDEARRHATLNGDQALGLRVLEMVSIIA